MLFPRNQVPDEEIRNVFKQYFNSLMMQYNPPKGGSCYPDHSKAKCSIEEAYEFLSINYEAESGGKYLSIWIHDAEVWVSGGFLLGSKTFKNLSPYSDEMGSCIDFCNKIIEDMKNR